MAWIDRIAGGWGGGNLGGNPQVPLPTMTAPSAVQGNVQNLANLYGLAAPTNQFNIQQAQQPLIQGLPNYTGMVQQSSQNIGQLLQGQVPSDVINLLQEQAAERGIMTGSPGSPNANAAYLRALGLTSLGLQQQGEQELTGAIARTPQAPLFNPAQFFVTPEQQQAAEAANAVYGAAPNPTAVARANLGAAQAGIGAGRGAVQAPPAPVMPSNLGIPQGFQSGTPASPYTSNFGTNEWLQSIGITPGAGQGADITQDPVLQSIFGTDPETQAWLQEGGLGADMGGGYAPEEQGYPVEDYGGGGAL